MLDFLRKEIKFYGSRRRWKIEEHQNEKNSFEAYQSLEEFPVECSWTQTTTKIKYVFSEISRKENLFWKIFVL